MAEGGGGGGEELTAQLEYTPTWVLAAVVTVIVGISLVMERILHFTGKYLKRTNQKPLYEALLKVEEELMLLGFISLMLTVFQGRIVTICVPPDMMRYFLPCPLPETFSAIGEHVQHDGPELEAQQRHLLSAESGHNLCKQKGKVPLLSVESLHHLHIFVFVLATVHVCFCLLTIVFGMAKIRQWKYWEDSIIQADTVDAIDIIGPQITYVREHSFIKSRFTGVGKRSTIRGWLHSFCKQFYGSVTRSDYIALRLGFIMTHTRGNPKFNFHKYMIRAIEADFKKVVGIKWYLWVFAMFFLLLNVHGWNAYFWICFIPFILLVGVGTKLEHVISQLAHEVAEKHDAIEGDLVVKPSDDHFWFGRPRLVLLLIQLILFQNAFEIAFFFWVWVQFGLESCYMGRIIYSIPRLVISLFIQLLCSYSILPLYSIVIQMGSYLKKSAFDEHIQVGLVGWVEKAKKKQGTKTNAPSPDIQLRVFDESDPRQDT